METGCLIRRELRAGGGSIGSFVKFVGSFECFVSAESSVLNFLVEFPGDSPMLSAQRLGVVSSRSRSGFVGEASRRSGCSHGEERGGSFERRESVVTVVMVLGS
jgi:hypothetical protein